ncbi:NAD(P)H dehydrogenase [Streptomyces eurocidicus]|uniref:NAD(P)H dehydrogenase n=1 Tax=Streptomyces eurocidicus TaxID=66423 RepID=A0A2N8NY57_STREU|nr:NAD(P)H-dependent oxidoreductase [Streptomyces eurocidicus]MBB5119813.1 NAD(P)H dehydrogenase (quinone) [Streptomyces eurocidicus]MBF6050832.1 flavodoxin family protein [Streptomyces eurocidicus]PNE33694.1 NAD(P)H dehydrogenase [Streptomyces eurocidicus]
MTETTSPRPKKILVVSAHPEPRSLNAALTAFAVDHLRAAGHEVRVSDLYAMKWKATVDADDFPGHTADRPLHVMNESERATLAARLSPDIAAEQEKVRWSDAVVLQFPMWWFGAPAILKGWIDRVFTAGFGYGPKVPPPYSEGILAGRRALVSVTAGARESSFSDRGIHGRLADVLHPLQHGLFWFTGMAPLEPFAVFGSNDLPEERFEAAKRAYAGRLDGLFTDEPVPFRSLVGGDYDHDMRLLPGVEAQGAAGLDLHVRPGG